MSAVLIVVACIGGMALCMVVMSVAMRWRRREPQTPDAEPERSDGR